MSSPLPQLSPQLQSLSVAEGVAIPPYHDLHVAVMGHELPPQRGEGWFESASDPVWGVHRWTTGKAHLHLYAVPGPQRLCLRLGVPIRALCKILAIQVNRRTVWRQRLTLGAHVIRIDLPPSASQGDILEIALLSRATVPAQWDGGPDQRALGVLVQRVWVEGAGDEEFQPQPPASMLRDIWVRLWAGRREVNVTRAGSPAFWLWAGPLFGFGLAASVVLRPLRALGLCPGRAGASREAGQEILEGPLWRPGPQDDARALRPHLQSVRESVTRGDWGQRSAQSFWMARIWRRAGLRPGDRVIAAGRAAPQSAALLGERFGARVAVLDDSPSGVLALREATDGATPGVLCDPRRWAIRPGSLDAIDLTEDALPCAEWVRLVHEAAQALRPGGRLILRASARERSWTWHDLTHCVSGGRLGRAAAPAEPEAVQAAWLRRVLEEAGLRVEHTGRTHAMFTLILDERLAGRPAPRWLARAAQWADEPWLWAGRSARVAVIARRVEA